jgi:hypothetical protein
LPSPTAPQSPPVSSQWQSASKHPVSATAPHPTTPVSSTTQSKPAPTTSQPLTHLISASFRRWRNSARMLGTC